MRKGLRAGAACHVDRAPGNPQQSDHDPDDNSGGRPSSPLASNCEFLVSIEADTIEEMSRLWQAFIVPMRLSALIRASVVFIAPASPMLLPAVPPSVANLAVSPNPSPATAPLLVAGASLQSPPVPPSADPSEFTSVAGPVVAVARQQRLRSPATGSIWPRRPRCF